MKKDITKESLGAFVDQLFLGVLSHNLYPEIVDFIKKFVPVIYKKFDGGKWTAKSPGTFEEPAFTNVSSTYIFKKHFCFDSSFKAGKLEIHQKIYNDEQWIDNIQNIQLWFEFDKSTEAKKLYNDLLETCNSFDVIKRFSSSGNMQRAEFTDIHSPCVYGRIQITLAKDYFGGRGYARATADGLKTVKKAGYKILITPDNELYEEY